MLDPDTPIPEDLAALIASRFAALAEPNRVRILDFLRREDALSVSEIAQRLDGSCAERRQASVVALPRADRRPSQGRDAGGLPDHRSEDHAAERIPIARLSRQRKRLRRQPAG